MQYLMDLYKVNEKYYESREQNALVFSLIYIFISILFDISISLIKKMFTDNSIYVVFIIFISGTITIFAYILCQFRLKALAYYKSQVLVELGKKIKIDDNDLWNEIDKLQINYKVYSKDMPIIILMFIFSLISIYIVLVTRMKLEYLLGILLLFFFLYSALSLGLLLLTRNELKKQCESITLAIYHYK
jgi:hypothetical protein